MSSLGPAAELDVVRRLRLKGDLTGRYEPGIFYVDTSLGR